MSDEKERKPMLIRSRVTGILYDDNSSSHVYKPLQAYRYLTAGAQLLDILPSHDREGNERLVFIFSKEDAAMLEPLWRARKL